MIHRVFVWKKKGFDSLSENLLQDYLQNLGTKSLKSIQCIQCYDVKGIEKDFFPAAINMVFREPYVDDFSIESCPLFNEKSNVIAVQFLPGQFDQRASSAEHCLELLSQKRGISVRSTRVYVLNDDIVEKDVKTIKQYLVNTTDSQEICIQSEKKEFSGTKPLPNSVKTIHGFSSFSKKEISDCKKQYSLALLDEDLHCIQEYFQKEQREPTITELKILDAYWSDHCRHTTFLTQLTEFEVQDSFVKSAYDEYLKDRKQLGRDKKHPFPTLMEIATINMRLMREAGKIDDVDFSDEINACTLKIKSQHVNGNSEDWYLLFKNETHNHPTEIEPFGGAATCVGGAIRDPLSGRAYVFQSLRVTGSGNPTMPIQETLQGKLPQRKITKEAANGFSSYGNQIGLATGQVVEIYHPGYIAKRMEVGAVLGAVKCAHVRREKPKNGDAIILVGGKTGRDGCGGASGSSKSHTDLSVTTSNQEVQKGNAPEERKIQRLFRNPQATLLIKKCNDFGAGGVSVAVGELADSLSIFLDAVPKKYDGLDGTELAISESQERMAVVIEKKDVHRFLQLAGEENVEATVIAEVTENNRVEYFWKNQKIANFSRAFLDSNGCLQQAKASIPKQKDTYFHSFQQENTEKNWKKHLSKITVASQKGLVEMFDNSVSGNTVLQPYGGKRQMTPQEGACALIPDFENETETGSLAAFGCDPYFMEENQFHGAMHAVIHSLTKMVAMGANHKTVRFSFQEYFEKLEKDKEKWGKPVATLLGAYKALKEFDTAAIGGKDSMSGTFMNIHVPPTFISFAFSPVHVQDVVSAELKKTESFVYLLQSREDIFKISPDFQAIKRNYAFYSSLITKKKVLSAKTVGYGGISATISTMCFGNNIGFEFQTNKEFEMFCPQYDAIIFETSEKLSEKLGLSLLGKTTEKQHITTKNCSFSLSELENCWRKPLNIVFPDGKGEIKGADKEISVFKNTHSLRSIKPITKPKVIIPVFPGTNSEYESKRVFEKYGAKASHFVFKNQESKDINQSIDALSEQIKESQILFFVGGFSAGDEPDGAAKYMASVVRNPKITDAIEFLLEKNDGLILGICNGFQLLVKTGLLPYGSVKPPEEIEFTVSHNKIGRHISQLVHTKIVSNASPWLMKCPPGGLHTIPASHSEGMFFTNEKNVQELISNNQVATQYCDINGAIKNVFPVNPNGSVANIEGIFSRGGKIFGKMGHSERITSRFPINGNAFSQEQEIFESGVHYFR